MKNKRISFVTKKKKHVNSMCELYGDAILTAYGLILARLAAMFKGNVTS